MSKQKRIKIMPNGDVIIIHGNKQYKVDIDKNTALFMSLMIPYYTDHEKRLEQLYLNSKHNEVRKVLK